MSAKPTKKPRGRTTEEKAALCQSVFELMRKGSSTRKACAEIGIAHSTLIMWMGDNAELADQYARARDDLVEHIADEIMVITDEPPAITAQGAIDSGGVAHQRLRVDTRKWLLSKLAPKKYGDKTAVEVSGTLSLESLVSGGDKS